MASNNNTPPPSDGLNDDFFDQIFSMPSAFAASSAATDATGALNYADSSTTGVTPMFSLGLSLDQQPKSDSSQSEREHPVQFASLFPQYGHNNQVHQTRPNISPPPQVLHGQAMQSSIAATPQPTGPRPRVRARRGQATDPHSIAERLRRERIAERIRALQELVPSTNKTDRAVMLDEIVEYVKFLRLQVKVLSMSRLGGAGAVAQLVADIPMSSSVEGDSSEGGKTGYQGWEKWSTDGTERQVAKLMEEDVGAAMQFLQSKALCIMPISLAAAICQTNPQPEPSSMKPEPNTPS